MLRSAALSAAAFEALVWQLSAMKCMEERGGGERERGRERGREGERERERERGRERKEREGERERERKRERDVVGA